jgi:ANTAR domain-containing protein/GAF domain-containing protein
VRTALRDGDEGGITLLEAGGPGTAAATGDVARRVDCSQYQAKTGGPCLDACRRQQVLRIDSSKRPTLAGCLWHRRRGGDRLYPSIPLVVGGDGVGALNLYCYREYEFPAADERLAATLGSCASMAPGERPRLLARGRLADELEQALATRGVIEQATGILMAQHHCPAEHARYLLAAVAQRNRLTLTEVAPDQVRRTGSQEPPRL